MTFEGLKKRSNELCVTETATSADFTALAKELDHIEEFPSYIRPLRAAFLSSYTIGGLSEMLRVHGMFHNLALITWNAPYNQFTQHILDPQSELFLFRPTVVYLLIDAPEILDEQHLETMLTTLLLSTEASIVVSNFLVSPGTQEEKVEVLNVRLEALAKEHRRIRIFDLKKFVNEVGTDQVWYTKYVTLGDFRISPQFFPTLSARLIADAVAIAGATRKCLVSDLDNTLWQGVVGEDGALVVIPNRALQEKMLALYEQGIILCINSKNNLEDALLVIDTHPDMLLRRDHFAAWRINWQPKDQNIIELAEELSIGIDSMVFMDDDPFQQGLVRDSLPEVAVIHPDMLPSYVGFTQSTLTEEDKRRGIMYVEERKRKELRGGFSNETEYLKTLHIHVEIKPITSETIPRVSQLSQKTNQYNLTTQRMTEEEVQHRLLEGYKIWTMRIWDSVGDYGLTGVIVVRPEGDAWVLDNFFMSCRVLGRGIEKSVVSFLLREAKQASARLVKGKFIPTKKNGVAHDFYVKNNFTLREEKDGIEQWEQAIAGDYPAPDFIHIVE